MTLDRLVQIVRLRLRSLLRGAAVDRELDEELRDHVERQVEEHIARGVGPEEARTLALRALGGVEQRKEEMRDARGVSLIEHVIQDVRLAFRQLRKQPAFAATAILSLALGIGANTAIFQLLNALSLRPLPVPAPHELVELRLTGDGRDGSHNGRNRQVSLPQFQAFAERQDVLTSLFAFGDTRYNLSATGEVRYVDAVWVSGNAFETLGVRAMLGRLIAPHDDQPGCQLAPVAVISYALWQSEFGGRRDIIGLKLPGTRSNATIIGVTPAEFFGIEVGRQFAVALPICASGLGRRDHWWLAAVGRLKPGVTRVQAQARLAQLLPSIQQTTMPDYRPELAAEYLKMGIEVVDASSGLSPLRRSYERPLWILLAISALVLLIAAVNLANLLLARATARRDEFAVRLALGGSPARVLQQVLTESLVIAALGAVAAIGVAMAAAQSIPALISTPVDRIHLDVSPDWRLFGFTAAAAVVTALIFGSAPALGATRASLRVGTRGALGNGSLSVRRALVAVQIAVTLVLLFGGLLFLRTFQNLSAVDVGVHERGVVAPVVFFSNEIDSDERRRQAYRALDERIFNLPGVQSAAAAYTTPMGGSSWDPDIETDRQLKGSSNANRVGPRYFETLGTPIVAGRDFNDVDRPGSALVAIVNQSFAATFFDGDALGRRFRITADGGGPGLEYSVVGVVADQKYQDLREANTRIFFTALAQHPRLEASRRYVIRSAAPPRDTIAAVAAAVAAFDPGLAVRYDILDTQIGEGMLRERLMARLSSLFGGVALFLAVVGLYGVVSYTVASRRAEIGVRIALGASRSRILGMVLGDVGRMVAIGIFAGAACALLASRAVGSLLYGLEPTDPATLAIAIASLLGTSLIAALLPARRAAGIDPLTALREQ
jgi:putative ABC transport system permease protein